MPGSSFLGSSVAGRKELVDHSPLGPSLVFDVMLGWLGIVTRNAGVERQFYGKCTVGVGGCRVLVL